LISTFLSLRINMSSENLTQSLHNWIHCKLIEPSMDTACLRGCNTVLLNLSPILIIVSLLIYLPLLLIHKSVYASWKE
jgi:hypothetical protein